MPPPYVNMLAATADVLDNPHSDDIYFRLYRRVQAAHPGAEVVTTLTQRVLPFLVSQGLLEKEADDGAPRTVGEAWHEPDYVHPNVEDDGNADHIRHPAVKKGCHVPHLRTGAVEFDFAGSRVRLYRATYQSITCAVENIGFEAMVDLTKGKRTVPHQVLDLQHEKNQCIWVFNKGWDTSYGMYKALKKTDAGALTLKEGMRASLERDTRTFLRSAELYRDLEVPWQRGILLLGPPGNGKTTAIRTILSQLDQHVLVVQDADEPRDIGDIFSFARNFTPCVLLLKDLDSLIKRTSLSLLLNELDGVTLNEGMLVIASTDHPERLDPALLSRPSRFDTKYTFDLPDEELRYAYLLRWLQRKYASSLQLGDKYSSLEQVARQLAKETDQFPFSLMKELFVSFALERASRGDPHAPVPVEHLFERARSLALLFLERLCARQGEL